MTGIATANEWLEADGQGGFASGTAAGIRTRRYHALLLVATSPPTGRVVLVNGFDAWIETESGPVALSSHRYRPDVVHPDGIRRLESFVPDPWPTWTFRLDEGRRVEHQLFVPKGPPTVALSWRLLGDGGRASGAGRPGVTLVVRPFLSGRDYHALHHENADFGFDAEAEGKRVIWRPYGSLPGVAVLSNGQYVHEPVWYRGFVYDEERARGLDFTEDLAAPGTFRFDLAKEEAVWIAAPVGEGQLSLATGGAEGRVAHLRGIEGSRRTRFPSRLHRSANAYVVQRGHGRTIVAGYPWFTDWGRDTFIALRGVCLAAGEVAAAGEILLEWAGAVSQGMLPNRFADRPEEPPEYNSVDASLWYCIAVHDYLLAAATAGRRVSSVEIGALRGAVDSILAGYAAGTRHGIRLDADGLVAAGEPGVQLTWMDAKVGDWVVTPRIGKPVEIQALWLNALRIASAWSPGWEATLARGLESFRARFWNESRGFLFDVVDAGHVPGAVDPAFRPNQVLAVGGLPYPSLEGERARRVVDAVEERLVTPLGLRTLAPGEPGYAPCYAGGVRERDGAYHQGTVWPWLLGPFVEAWVRVRGDTGDAREEARIRFLEPLLQHLDQAGLGHVSEVADGDPPHTPGGCPFQAWSVGEALRLDRIVLASEGATSSRVRPGASPAPGTRRRR